MSIKLFYELIAFSASVAIFRRFAWPHLKSVLVDYKEQFVDRRNKLNYEITKQNEIYDSLKIQSQNLEAELINLQIASESLLKDYRSKLIRKYDSMIADYLSKNQKRLQDYENMFICTLKRECVSRFRTKIEQKLFTDSQELFDSAVEKLTF